ncbi:MAG: PIN domain-containing protein [Terriglobales bacterium]
MSAVLDTHTVLWYLENSSELSGVVRATIEDTIREARDVHVSVISVIEAVYLAERKRIPMAALQRLRNSLANPSAGLLIAPVDTFVADALDKIPRSVVPDMPDASSLQPLFSLICHWSLETAAYNPLESPQSGK